MGIESSYRKDNLLSVLMPAFNEQNLVWDAVQRVLENPLAGEIIIVNDGSIDGTEDVLKKLEQSHKKVTILQHSYNQGKGVAIRTALSQATLPYFVIHDCDNEYDTKAWQSMLKILQDQRAGFVIGTRFKNGIPGMALPFHSLFNISISALISKMWSIRVTDVECCTKMGDTDLFRNAWREKGFGIEIELTGWAVASNLKIQEVPVNYAPRSYRQGKKISWRDGIEALGCVWKYRPR